MKKLKKRYKVLLILLMIYVGISTISVCFNYGFALGQYNHNMKQWKSDKYYNQLLTNQFELSNYKYGFGNVVDNGCGAMSIYNILKLDSRNVSFPSVIQKVSLNGLPLFGYLGTYPHTVMWALQSYGYKTSISFDTNNFDTIAQKHKYNIYVYISTSFGHYELAHDFNGTDFQFVNPTIRTTFAKEVKNTSECFFKALISID